MNRNRKVIARAMVVAMATSVVGAYNYQNPAGVVMAEEETTELLEQAAGAVLEGSEGTESEEGIVTAEGSTDSKETNETADPGKGLFKEESVYVKADPEGNVDKTTVTEWIKNPKNGEFEDESGLKDIKNIKGEEEFTRGNGNDLKWKSEGNDIYYQGTINEKLPVDVNISYKLNGKTVKAEELAGKDGKVEIHIDYENHTKQNVKVRGENSEMYTPFTMVTAMMLPTDEYSNVTIDNGKIMSDADKNIVVGLGFPGLAENLKLEDADVDIPESVTVTADVRNASVGPTITMASAEIMNEFSLNDVEDFDSLEDSLHELEDASAKLEDGSKDASDGAKKLADGSRDAANGAKELAEGSQEAASGAGELAEGAGSAAAGAEELAVGTKNAADGAKELAEGTRSAVDGVKELADGTKSAADGAKEVEAGSKELAAGVNELNSKSGELINGVNALASGVEGYTNGVSDLAAGAGRLAAGADSLNQNAEFLSQSLAAVSQGLQSVVNPDGGTAASLAAAGNALASADNVLAGANPAPGQYELNSAGVSNAAAQIADLTGGLVDQGTIEALIYSYVDAIPVGGTDLSAGIAAAMSEIAAAQNSISAAQSEEANAQAVREATLRELAAQLQEVSGGVTQLSQGAADLSAGIGGISAGASRLAGQNEALMGGINQLSAGVPQLSAGVNQLSAGASKLSQGAGALSAGNQQLAAGADALLAGSQELKAGADALSAGNQQLAAGAGALAAGNRQLSAGAGALAAGNRQLSDGASALLNGNQQLAEGAGALADGNQQLADGMSEFKTSGVDKLTDVFDNDIQSVKSRIDAMSELGKSYKSFAGIKEGMDGSTKFIIETKGIE